MSSFCLHINESETLFKENKKFVFLHNSKGLFINKKDNILENYLIIKKSNKRHLKIISSFYFSFRERFTHGCLDF